MIVRLIGWAMTLRGAGWFMPGPAGRFPMPDAWQGWVAFGALVVALAVAAVLPPDFRTPCAIAALAIYAAIMYWTYRAD